MDVGGDGIELFSAPCPGGYTLTVAIFSPDVFVCTCDDAEKILACEDDQDTIIIQVPYILCSTFLQFLVERRGVSEL